MPRTPRTPENLAQKVLRLAEHERCQTSYVVRPVSEEEVQKGYSPSIKTLAHIHVVRPPKGHGERALRVGVQSWHNGEVFYHYAEARGYGYDKLSAALQDASIGGHVLAHGSDTLRRLASKNGWTLLGDVR